jgi:pimeloyl-ACP methyl ester carboxylesterase
VSETQRTVTADDGTTISYTVFDGTGPAIVILHGLAGSSREFVPTARALSPRRVILIDQRGHGASTRAPEDTTRDAFVADVVRVVAAEETEPVDLVGQSMGAHTALLVAAAHPGYVRRLVMLEGNEGGGSPEEHAVLGAYFRSWPVPFPSRDAATAWLGVDPLARAWVADMEETGNGFSPRFDPDVMVRILAGVAVPRRAEWESISLPTLVVYADGGMFTAEQKNAFVSRGANVTRVDLASASHDAHLDAFEGWSRALGDFLHPSGSD